MLVIMYNKCKGNSTIWWQSKGGTGGLDIPHPEDLCGLYTVYMWQRNTDCQKIGLGVVIPNKIVRSMVKNALPTAENHKKNPEPRLENLY